MGAQKRVLVSRHGGAKGRDISVFNIIDIYVGKMSLEKVRLKPSASIRPDKAPCPHLRLFNCTGSETGCGEHWGEKITFSQQPYKVFPRKCKGLGTLSILPNLPNYTKYQNTSETSKIPNDLTFLFPKWAQGLDFLRASQGFAGKVSPRHRLTGTFPVGVKKNNHTTTKIKYFAAVFTGKRQIKISRNMSVL